MCVCVRERERERFQPNHLLIINEENPVMPKISFLNEKPQIIIVNNLLLDPVKMQFLILEIAEEKEEEARGGKEDFSDLEFPFKRKRKKKKQDHF